ncbi:MAG: hypothetical protein HOG58_04175, partial [Euryarchaeota archaeon]|nr:hypothetical protein [Euryarchaeota archaeon]
DVSILSTSYSSDSLRTLKEFGTASNEFSSSDERGKHSSPSHESDGTSRHPDRAEEKRIRLINATLMIDCDS